MNVAKPVDLLYRAVFENAGDAIIIWRRANGSEVLKIVDANPAACRRLGYARDEMIRLTDADLNAPDSLRRSREILAAPSDNGKLTLEVALRTKTGQELPSEANCQVFIMDGRPAIVAVYRDIAERKEQEERRQRALEHETSLRSKLEADTDMRTNYTRALVHELKTPLTLLMASSDFLVSHIKEEPLLSFAKNISFGAASINRRIDELHDLMKLEMGSLQLEFYPVPTRRLLSDIAAFARPAAERSELAFNVELPARLPTVLGDRERLQQVIMNLLNNAFKYTPKGGSVWLKAYTRAKELVIEVRDTGCGIPEDAQQALFQPYQRRDPSHQRKDGLGLGLAITKAIVERYKGRIWVESRPGAGSRFFVALPTTRRNFKNESADC
ncbi:PAS domain-containing sensor histidine kinase [Dehalogenimonas alkenigignens]|uniref:PAS domain-containing sensor histidine kinase n=1 Tax=Dehalogenimonas alkenigignens TaxID=1217799 RepID=UPI000D58873C|nr:PAS domain-containing sensor histidine kinase [Dehalogenimonas alkenigignens]PVV83987.1 PAS domain-containing sensor histidine kinase [Dehalogenimonas alkenigignens]